MRNSMDMILKQLLTFIAIFSLAGCTALNPNFTKPELSVNSFKVLPSGGLNPTFEIGLRVINPNSTALTLKGMSYTASIEGNKVFTGVSNQLPIVPAYGEEDIKLNAQADLFGGFKLIADLMKPRKTPVTYTLKMKLDVGTFALPIYITHEGILDLAGSNLVGSE